MGVQVAASQETVSVTDHALLAKSLEMLTKAVNEVRDELKSKPSTEQVESMIAHLVSQREHDAHTFKIEQHGIDLERLSRETKEAMSKLRADLVEKIQENSPKRWRENATAWLSLVAVVVSLLAALGVFKRP